MERGGIGPGGEPAATKAPSAGADIPEPGQLTGRAATEAALEEVALRLLDRDGALAGLNLREVADEAGVNRGLVYHYYGSRGQLLRQALRRRLSINISELFRLESMPILQRWRGFFRISLERPEPIRLATLLLLDGTVKIRMMPMRENTREALENAVEHGQLAADTDLTALHALLVSATHGYTLYRERFADELGIPLADLDQRVESLLYDRLLPRSVTPESAAPTQRGN